jgi:ketosteroid isomerase-like protein
MEEKGLMAENVAVVKDLYAAFARGDGPGAFALMDPAIVWNEAEGFPYSDRNPYVGPAAIGEGVFFRLATEWDGFVAAPEKFLDAGESVVAMGRYTATHKGTGKALDAQFAHVFGLSDGKVVSFQQYTDTAQASRVTGS